MTGDASADTRILGTLRSAGGKGVVRVEDRLDSDVGNVWSALTDPLRLIHWIGEVEGDLREGGEFRNSTSIPTDQKVPVRVEACESPRRLLLTMEVGEPGENVIEVTLAADGEQTLVVWEERGVPVQYLAGYGGGAQIHVEDLAAYLAGRERRDATSRWHELQPAYEALAANVG